MSEILFRGKRLDGGGWAYGDLVCHYENQRRIIAHDQLAYTYAECGICRLVSEHFHEVKPNTVGQYTGLTDKNGMKIFDGDAVIYYHEKKKLTPCDDASAYEMRHGEDPESGLQLAYRAYKTIRYKGFVTISPMRGVSLNLQNNCQWWNCEDEGCLTRVEVIGNIYE